MLAQEGTDTCRQVFHVEGGSVTVGELPDAIAARVKRAMDLLADKTEMAKKIDELEAQLETAKTKARLLKEAAEAPVPEAASLPVETAEPPRRGRRRR